MPAEDAPVPLSVQDLGEEHLRRTPTTIGGMDVELERDRFWLCRREREFQHRAPPRLNKAANVGEVEMAYAAQLLMELGRTVKARMLWTDTSACNSILPHVGHVRLKHPEALQLDLQAKTRSREFKVKKVLGILNPADVMTKFADNMTLERHCEMMGLIELNYILEEKVEIHQAGIQRNNLRKQDGFIPNGMMPRGREQKRHFGTKGEQAFMYVCACVYGSVHNHEALCIRVAIAFARV